MYQPVPPMYQPVPPRHKPRASTGLAVTAGVLGVLTAAMLAWFAIYNVGDDVTIDGETPSVIKINIIFGFIAAAVLLTAAAFTLARMIVGAWTLCGLTLFCVVMIFASPLLRGEPMSHYLDWVFGFEKSNGVAMALTVIIGAATAVVAALAGALRSRDGLTVH